MMVLDLFSGIGGFSLGLTRAGMRTTAFCEIEEYPRSILRKHWPDVPIFNDVRKLHAADLPEAVDLICGGYPCQPFSVAGKRQGKEDDRHLWPEIVRLIRELDATTGKPTWCIFENVAGHVSMGLDTVLADLEGEGYACWPFIIPACAVGGQHRRDRVWIVANAKGKRQKKNKLQKVPPLQDIKRERDGRSPNIHGIDWIDIKWEIQSKDSGKIDGLSSWMDRVKALGNAVVPQIPEIIGRAIMEISG